MPSKRKYPATLLTKLKKIRLVILDVDGVLTDGRIIFGSDGADYRCFHAHDGFGITRARECGLKLAILSGKNSKAVTHRAKWLAISDVIQGAQDKVLAYRKLQSKYKLKANQVCFIGDDEFDLPLLKLIGLSAAPLNGVAKVRRQVDYVTHTEGGRGAVREVLDMILEAQGYLT